MNRFFKFVAKNQEVMVPFSAIAFLFFVLFYAMYLISTSKPVEYKYPKGATNIQQLTEKKIRYTLGCERIWLESVCFFKCSWRIEEIENICKKERK